MNRSFTRQQEEKRREARKRSMPWREYWHLYLCLVATAILTAFAGVYLGLAPSADGQIVFLSAWDMGRRVFFALYYAGSFILVAEGATLFAKDKLLNRDVEEDAGKIVDIPPQRRSMTAMLWVSVLAIVGTTVAAGYILAAWLGALDKFVTIPAAAQTWVVLAPPALLVFDAVMALIYQQNSKQSELDRWIQQQKRMAEAGAQETWAKEYVQQYNSVAPEAARKAARASAMTDARKWAGNAVDDEKDYPPKDAPVMVDWAHAGQPTVMEVPKHPDSPTYSKGDGRYLPSNIPDSNIPNVGEVAIWGGPDHTGPQAHVVTEEDVAEMRATVMEENTMTPPEEPAPAPVQEGGADQPSPT